MTFNVSLTALRRWFAAALVYGVLIAVSVAPIFLGLNRPIYWMGFTSIIAGLLAASVIAQGLGRAADRPWPMGAALTSLTAAYALGILLPPIAAIMVGEEATSIVNPIASISASMRILGYMSLAALILLLRPSVEQIMRSLKILIIVISLYAAYGLAAVQSPDLIWHDEVGYVGVATGTFVNRNSFATFLAMGACLSTAYAMRKKDGNRARRTGERINGISSLMLRMVPWSSTILLVAATLATGSRMGTFVLFFGIATVVALSQATSHRSAIDNRSIAVSLVLPMMAFALSMVFIALFGGTVLDRVGSLEQDFSVRMALYRNMMSAVLSQPLIGVGLDGFEQGFKGVQEIGVSTDVRWDNGHNTYLENWFELGIVVGTLPILIALAALRILIRSLKSGVPNAFIPIAAVAMIMVVAIHSLVDFSLEMPAITALLVYVVSIALLVAQRGVAHDAAEGEMRVATRKAQPRAQQSSTASAAREPVPEAVVELKRRMARLRNDGKL